MIELIIYFTGFLASWFIIRWDQHRYWNTISWDDILGRFIGALFSWITLLGLVIIIGIIEVVYRFKDNSPPKWLQ